MNIELVRRALACKHWRWMPGMRTVRDDGHGFHIGCTVAASKVKPEWLPDLTDPATLGCLLALVREICGDSEMHLTLGGAGWVWLSGESRVANVVLDIPAGKTEAEAITLALETAP